MRTCHGACHVGCWGMGSSKHLVTPHNSSLVCGGCCSAGHTNCMPFKCWAVTSNGRRMPTQPAAGAAPAAIQQVPGYAARAQGSHTCTAALPSRPRCMRPQACKQEAFTWLPLLRALIWISHQQCSQIIYHLASHSSDTVTTGANLEPMLLTWASSGETPLEHLLKFSRRISCFEFRPVYSPVNKSTT